MIDSINLSLDKIYVDMNHLKKIGIRWINNKKKSVIYFKYETVNFSYYYDFKTLSLKTNTHKILVKNDITLSDKVKFVMIVNRITNEILNTTNVLYYFKTTRVDYYVDITVDELREIYIILLKKHKSFYKYMIEENEYDTSKYLRSSGKGLNLYDKQQETEDKKDPLLDWDYKLHDGVIRLEVQLYKPKLKYEEKYVERTIDTYWSKESMKKYYFQFLEKYFYEGNYYHLDTGFSLIQNSNGRKDTKANLTSFMEQIINYGIDSLKDNYCYNVIDRYTKKLNAIGLNPIIIDDDYNYDNLENLLNIARRTAEEKYFK